MSSHNSINSNSNIIKNNKSKDAFCKQMNLCAWWWTSIGPLWTWWWWGCVSGVGWSELSTLMCRQRICSTPTRARTIWRPKSTKECWDQLCKVLIYCGSGAQKVPWVQKVLREDKQTVQVPRLRSGPLDWTWPCVTQKRLQWSPHSLVKIQITQK